MERTIDVVGIEGERVELSASPLEHVLMLWVPGIVHHLEEMVVARRAANILRRTRTAPGQNHRIARRWNAGNDLLEEELVLPSVAEIVIVDAPVAGPAK